MRRHRVSKKHSARRFRQDGTRTKSINMKGAPMRGGIRL